MPVSVTRQVPMRRSFDTVFFAVQTGGGITCLEAEYGFSPIATQVSVVEGIETYCYGSVIYSLKGTGPNDLSAFKGKRLGVGYPLAPGGFQLGAQVRAYPFAAGRTV